MAVSATNLIANGSAVSGTTFTTASISPTSNSLVLAAIVVENTASTNPGNPTLSGNGLTWVLVDTAGGGSILYDSASGSRRKLFVFRALGASPSSGAVTITTAETDAGCLWVIDEFSGTDTTGTNGSGAIVQSAVGKDETGTVNHKTVTLGAFGSTNNATYGASGWATGTLTFTAGTGFTKLNNFGLSSPGIDVATEFAADNRTSVDETASANDFVGQIGLEIKAAAVVASSVTGFMTTNTGFWGK